MSLSSTERYGTYTQEGRIADSSVFYLDGKVIGIHLDRAVTGGVPSNATGFDYLRLTMRRDA